MARTVTPIEIVLEERVFSCLYSVQSGMLTVWHPYLGSRTRMFHREIVRADAEDLVVELFKVNRERISSASDQKC